MMDRLLMGQYILLRFLLSLQLFSICVHDSCHISRNPLSRNMNNTKHENGGRKKKKKEQEKEKKKKKG